MQAKIININTGNNGAKVIKMSTVSILVPFGKEIKTVVLTVSDKGQRA